MKKGIRKGTQHCSAMKRNLNGIVFVNVKSLSKRNIAKLKESLIQYLEMVEAVDPKLRGVIWKKQHWIMDDRGQKDLLLVFGNKIVNPGKATILTASNQCGPCMSLENYRKKYCCEKRCRKS